MILFYIPESHLIIIIIVILFYLIIKRYNEKNGTKMAFISREELLSKILTQFEEYFTTFSFRGFSSLQHLYVFTNFIIIFIILYLFLFIIYGSIIEVLLTYILFLFRYYKYWLHSDQQVTLESDGSLVVIKVTTLLLFNFNFVL
jgi:biotin-(acetyl-CoA carboxylase) ligase